MNKIALVAGASGIIGGNLAEKLISVRHVALVTGLKHYLGPFDAYAREGFLPETPLHEEQPRLDVENFYYAQEDEIGYDGAVHPLEPTIADDGELWRNMAVRYVLKEPDINRLASAWHTDLDLGRPIEVVTDMSKSRKMGFTVFQQTEDSFFDLFGQLRAARLIP